MRRGGTGGGTSRRPIANGRQRPAPSRDGRVIVVFGPPDGLMGWQVVETRRAADWRPSARAARPAPAGHVKAKRLERWNDRR